MIKFLAVAGLTTLCCGLFALTVLWPVGAGLVTSGLLLIYGIIYITELK